MGEVWGRVAGARTVSEGEEEEEEEGEKEGEVGEGERHRHLPSGKLLINKGQARAELRCVRLHVRKCVSVYVYMYACMCVIACVCS